MSFICSEISLPDFIMVYHLKKRPKTRQCLPMDNILTSYHRDTKSHVHQSHKIKVTFIFHHVEILTQNFKGSFSFLHFMSISVFTAIKRSVLIQLQATFYLIVKFEY